MLTAWLALTTVLAFSGGNDGNDHGQNDCQCIGIGIQVNPPNIPGKTPPTPSPGTPVWPLKEAKNIGGQSLWYTYLEIYYLELRNSFLKKGGN
jgi:hypothetical protein